MSRPYSNLILRIPTEIQIATLVGLLVLFAHAAILIPLRLAAAAPPYQNFIGLGITSVLQLLIMLWLAHWMCARRIGRLSGLALMQLPLIAAAIITELVDTAQFYERFNLPYELLTPLSFFGHTLRVYMVFLVWSALFSVVMALIDLERQGRNLAEAEALARAAELAALRYQIQPHFLFNTLSTLHALVDDDERDAALKMLEKLSIVFRSVLAGADRDFATLAEEIAFLRDYLAIEQFRFGAALQIEYDLEERVLHHGIPRLLLQPLVENAIKHARPRNGDALKIKIETRIDSDRLMLVVTDNGPGLGATPVSGVGLRNVVDRLERYFGEGAQLELNDHKPAGLQALIHIDLSALETSS